MDTDRRLDELAIHPDFVGDPVSPGDALVTFVLVDPDADACLAELELNLPDELVAEFRDPRSVAAVHEEIATQLRARLEDARAARRRLGTERPGDRAPLEQLDAAGGEIAADDERSRVLLEGYRHLLECRDQCCDCAKHLFEIDLDALGEALEPYAGLVYAVVGPDPVVAFYAAGRSLEEAGAVPVVVHDVVALGREELAGMLFDVLMWDRVEIRGAARELAVVACRGAREYTWRLIPLPDAASTVYHQWPRTGTFAAELLRYPRAVLETAGELCADQPASSLLGAHLLREIAEEILRHGGGLEAATIEVLRGLALSFEQDLAALFAAAQATVAPLAGL